MSSNQNSSYKMGGGSNYIRQRERILSRVKVTGEGAVDVSTIKNQYFNFFMFFIFNPMAEVAQEDKLTGENPFSLTSLAAHLTPQPPPM
jgi:hypothetical protein